MDSLNKLPDKYCMIVPSKKVEGLYGAQSTSSGGIVGFDYPPKTCIGLAYYGSLLTRTFYSDQIHFPTNRFDFISTLPGGHDANNAALQKEVKKIFGVVGKTEIRPMDVMALRVKTPNAVAGLKINNYTSGNPDLVHYEQGKYLYRFTMKQLGSVIEYGTWFPVMDETGLTNRYDFDLEYTKEDMESRNWEKINTVLDKIGLELVPTNMPLEVLVVEKAK